MIKKVVLEIDGKEINLTIEQAKALKGDLDKLFDTEKEYVPYYPFYPATVEPYRVSWTLSGTQIDPTIVRFST